MRSAQRRTESEMLAPQAGWSAKTIPAPDQDSPPSGPTWRGLAVTPASPLHEPEDPTWLPLPPFRHKYAGRGLSAATAPPPDCIQPEHEF
jgi:hypothetical protein